MLWLSLLLSANVPWELVNRNLIGKEPHSSPSSTAAGLLKLVPGSSAHVQSGLCFLRSPLLNCWKGAIMQGALDVMAAVL